MVSFNNTKLLYTLIAVGLINTSVSTESLTNMYKNGNIFNTILFVLGWIMAFYALALDEKKKEFLKINFNMKTFLFLIPCLAILISYIMIKKELRDNKYYVAKISRVTPLIYIFAWLSIVMLLTLYKKKNQKLIFGLSIVGAGLIMSNTLLISPMLQKRTGPNCISSNLHTLGWLLLLAANSLNLTDNIFINVF